ncbi:MAG TPA: hypothetical protein VEB19_06365 [Gemmatimonadaceae bacterium]|nr:hypothetical protein [Gemmatimonadaceae bacterium]
MPRSLAAQAAAALPVVDSKTLPLLAVSLAQAAAASQASEAFREEPHAEVLAAFPATLLRQAYRVRQDAGASWAASGCPVAPADRLPARVSAPSAASRIRTRLTGG